MAKDENMAEGEVEHTEYDWDRVQLLVRIVDSLRGHPNLKPLADAAMAELNAMANPPQEEEAVEEETVDE